MSGIDDPFEPTNERHRRALGTFIHDFAILEAAIFDLLCSVSGLTREMGAALFSGARADAMISLIKRCYEVRGDQPPAFLTTAFQQVGVLNAARNDAVHLPTFVLEDDESAVLATGVLRNMSSRLKEVLFAPSDLEAMSRDARIIPAYLLVAACEIREPGTTPDLSAEMRGRQPSWHYRPPAQGNPRHRG